MNSAAKLINEQVVIGGWSWSFVKVSTYQFSINMLLTGLLFSALSVVYVTNMSRNYTQQAEHSLHSQNTMQVEYGQLLLEKSTLSSQARIEKLAKKQLNMQIPKTKQVIVVGK
jgi:cell division protein FtsL